MKRSLKGNQKYNMMRFAGIIINQQSVLIKYSKQNIILGILKIVRNSLNLLHICVVNLFPQFSYHSDRVI